MTAAPRVACSEWLLGEDLLGGWELVNRAGVAGIEVVDSSQGFARRLETLKQAQRSGVVLSTLCLQPAFLGQHDPRMIHLGLRAAKLAVSAAGELGVAGVVMPVGVPPSKRRDSTPSTAPYLLNALIELAEFASTAGVLLLIEPLNRYEEGHVNRLEQAAALCDEIDSRSAGVVADFFHMNIEESDPVVALQTFVGRVKHVHVADSNRLQPGAGHLSIPHLVGVLARSGYGGWLTLECEVRGPLESELRQAVNLLVAAWNASQRQTPTTPPRQEKTVSEFG